MSPTVSVIMPVYNVENYVAAAVVSVLEQTFEDFELLIIDDGSTDASIDICRLIEDPRIRIIQQENRGLAGARNTGIRKARGHYIGFLDSDDMWRPEKLEVQLGYLVRNTDIGVSYSASTLIDDAGEEIGVEQTPKTSNVTPQDVFLRNPVGNGSAPIIRREVFDEIGFDGGRGYKEYFDETFRQSEDIECWMRVALTTSWRFGGVVNPLTLYRVNEGGLSAQIEKQFESWEAMCANVRTIAPAFFKKWARISRAFQLRYLARRAARMRDRRAAMSLAMRALFCHPGILAREPKKTIQTIGAAVLLRIAPISVYLQIEAYALSERGGVHV